MVYFISAVGENYEYGRSGTLPWERDDPGAKTDMLAFKFYTHGKTVIMGWNTWVSMGCKPLPGRKNVVISRRHSADFKSLAEAIAAYPDAVVIGGAGVLTDLCKNHPDKIDGGVVNVFKYGFPGCDVFFNINCIPMMCKKYDFEHFVRHEYFRV